MTEDQIKAIAEEYVKHAVAQKYAWRYHSESDFRIAIQAEAMRLLKYLSSRYCIVEREKVIDNYEGYKILSEKHFKASERRIAKAMMNSLTAVFGTSMFNQNEE